MDPMPDLYVWEMLVDALPDSLQIAVDRQTVADSDLEFVISRAKRWTPGQTVVVAFRGGSDALYEKIAEAASGWLAFGNLALEFKDPATGAFHLWRPSDTEFFFDIRISFDQPGYWSLVGNDSVNAGITTPGEASMNFGGYVQQLPADWAATVLHEFGHAFGLQHEHQHPAGACENEFRWDDDPGYVLKLDSFGQAIPNGTKRPGIYTVLGHPPNRWSRAKVDHNLRQLPPSSAFSVSAFDKDSIMKYFFGAWMFHHGEQSACFSQRNLALSELDKQGFGEAYPRES